MAVLLKGGAVTLTVAPRGLQCVPLSAGGGKQIQTEFLINLLRGFLPPLVGLVLRRHEVPWVIDLFLEYPRTGGDTFWLSGFSLGPGGR